MKTIKILLINLLFGLLLQSALGQTYSDGVYVKRGVTVVVDKSVHEILTTNNTDILYFSNELIVKVNTNSDFMIDSFYQEVINTNSLPEKLKSSSCNFSGTLMKGSVIVTYTGGNENSSCIISTPFSTHELSKGTFYLQVSDSKEITITLDGELKTEGNNKGKATTPTGYAVISVNNDSSGITDSKISIYTDKVKTSVMDRLLNESKEVTNLKKSILFIKIDKKIIGIDIN